MMNNRGEGVVGMRSRSEYDDQPIYYCRRCLSLDIKQIGEGEGEGGIDYCDDCGCTDIGEMNIYEWEEVYRKRYGKYYINYGKKR